MPSVEMRRTTRVFGVVKGVDGARVLRSGRRLWPDSGEGKLRRANDGDGWYHHHPLIKKHNNSNGPGGLKCKPNGWANVQSIKLKQQKQEEEKGGGEEEEVVTEICESVNEVKLTQKMKQESEVLPRKDHMFGVVYRRKRKRNGEQKEREDKMYGIQFSRRQRRRKSEEESGDNGASLRAFGVVFQGICGVTSSSGFLSLVLGYMKKSRLELPDLASFLLAQPISGAFSLHGIRFVWVRVVIFCCMLACFYLLNCKLAIVGYHMSIKAPFAFFGCNIPSSGVIVDI